MSFRLVETVLGLNGLHRTDKQVLATLARKANDDGTSCFPGQKWIACQVGISERKVRDALRHLEHHQWIKRRRRRRDTTIYTITIDAGVACLVANRLVCLGDSTQVLDRTLGSLNSVNPSPTRTTTATRRERVTPRIYRGRTQSLPKAVGVTQSTESGPQGPVKEFTWTPPLPREPQPEVDLAVLRERAAVLAGTNRGAT